MSWRVDGRTFASKVKNPAYGVSQHGGRGRNTECPSCGFVFDDNIRTPEWPGLPAGVKFDPSDQELLEHLAAKVHSYSNKSHPFIDEFIPTLGQEEGICYTHPERLPGNRSDGSSIHFFHKPAKAYTTGTRKRRKVQLGEDSQHGCEMRWHKTGKTRAIIDNGKQLGCKKIMVLYASQGKKGKTEKTNWVMHQYHLGMHEDEREGEFVVSKVFYQTQMRQSTAMHQEEEEKTEIPGVEAWEQESTFSFLKPSTSLFCPTTSSPFQHAEEALMQQTEVGGLLEHVPPTFPLTLDEERTSAGDVCQKELSENATCLSNPDALMADVNLSASKKIDQVNDAVSEQGILDPQSCSLKKEDVVAQGSDNVKRSDIPCDESYQIPDTSDADLMKLLCNENMIKFLKQKSKKQDPAQSFDSDGAGQVGDSTTLDNIVLDTPPDFLSLESLINSQETLDWLGKRKLWTDSQKLVGSEDANLIDFLKDSQSSGQFDMN